MGWTSIIDHYHNMWYARRVVNPYYTLSKVDSLISGQALSKSGFYPDVKKQMGDEAWNLLEKYVGPLA